MTNKSHGIKVSQRDYDVRTAKDYKLEYSSSFPMMPIIASGEFDIGNNVGATIFTHNLGYVPMWLILHEDTGGSFGNGAAGQSHMVDNFLNNFFDMSTTALVHNGDGGATTVKGRYYIFGIDLEKDFTAPIIASSTEELDTTSDADLYGIKVAKDGKSVFSTDLRDFTIHSGTRSPMIHSVDSAQYPASAVTIDHNLGYIPFPFLFWEFNANAPNWQHIPSQSVSVTSTQATFTNSSGGSSDNYSLVLLKEPLSVN